MRNILHVEADIKGQRRIPAYTVTQNDSVSIVVSVLDGGSPVNLDEVSTMTIACTRRDGLVVVKDGTQTGPNEVTFDLGTTEIEQTGKVDAVIQLYSADGRVSTIKFSFMVTKDPTGEGYVPSEDERTLIEVVLGDGPLTIERAETAAANAESAAEYIDEKKPLIDKFTDEQTSLQAQLDEVARGATNVETSQARVSSTGTAYGTLKERLDSEYQEVTTQLAQKAQQTEITRIDSELAQKAQQTEITRIDSELAQKANDNDVRKKSVPIGLNDADEEMLSAIQGGEGASFNLLSIPRPKSVTPETTTFFTINSSSNVFNFDSKDNVVGKRILSDGAYEDNTLQFVSHPIQCVYGDVIRVVDIGTDYYGGCLFDESDNLIRRVQASGGIYTVSDSNAAYIRLNGYISKLSSIMVTVNHPMPDVYQPYRYDVSLSGKLIKGITAEQFEDGTITPKKTNFIYQSKNKIDKRKCEVGILSGSYGSVDSSIKSYYTTPYVFIPAGQKIIVSPIIRRLQIFSTDDGTVRYLEMVDSATENYTYTPDIDCYLKASFLTEYLNSVQLEFVDSSVTTPSEYEPYGYYIDDLLIEKSGAVKTINNKEPNEMGNVFIPKSHLYDKTIVCFGDSITAMNYTQPIRDITGAIVVKQGYTGTRMNPTPNVNESNRAFSFLRLVESIVSGDFTLQDSLVSQSNFASEWSAELAILKEINFNNVHCITIAYGTNDWDSATILKNDDPFDETTYYGGARKAIKTLLEVFPHIKVLFVTPIKRANVSSDGSQLIAFGEDYIKESTGYTVGTYAECLKEVGKSLGQPVINTYNTLGVCEFNQPYYFGNDTKYYGDGVHPNAIGRDLLGTRIANELLNHY